MTSASSRKWEAYRWPQKGLDARRERGAYQQRYVTNEQRRRRTLFKPTVCLPLMRRCTRVVWFGLGLIFAALLLGCGHSKEQALQELAKLNVQFTPDDFVQSANKGDLKAVQLFLEAGIDGNSQDASGSTALMAAAKKGRIDVANKLLEQKLNLNLQNKQGETALMLAAANSQADIVKLLLRKNADPNIQDQSGWSALMKAVYQGSTACVQALVGQSHQEVNRALLVAALTGQKEIAKVLLENGAEIDTRADDGRTPLMLAAAKGDNDLVAALLAAGADPTLIDKSGATGAALAAGKGYNDLAKRLQKSPPPASVASMPGAGVTSASPQTGLSPQPADAVSDKDFLAKPESETPSAPDSHREAGNGSSAPVSTDTNATKPISVVEIEEAFLPVMLTDVTGKKAKIQAVGGDEYNVAVGDELKGLSYKVAEVQVRHTEDKDGNPVDNSVVKLRNTKSGHEVELIKGVPAQDRPPYAILGLPDSDQTLKVEVDQNFSVPSDPDHTYKVLDIRPAQVIVRRIEDNRVITLEKKARN
jgi:ankyrin repeat protein